MNARQRFWGETKVSCELCQGEPIQYLRMNNKQAPNDAPNQYRYQYVNDRSTTPKQVSIRENSFISAVSSSFNQSLATETRTTITSYWRTSSLLDDDIPLQNKPGQKATYPTSNGSILVRAYAKQQSSN